MILFILLNITVFVLIKKLKLSNDKFLVEEGTDNFSMVCICLDYDSLISGNKNVIGYLLILEELQACPFVLF